METTNALTLNEFERKADGQISKELPTDVREGFKALVQRHRNLFVTSRKELKLSKLPMLSLRLKDGCTPRMQRPYRMSELQLKNTRETVKDLLEGGQASLSCSEIAAPTHLVQKKDKKWRMVVDYRNLNSCLEGIAYPLPNIEANLAELANSKYYAIFDMFAGYEQIGVEPESRYLTAFVTPDGLYEMNACPYGISTLPGHFSKCMAMVLGDLRWRGALNYLDDVMLHAVTPEKLLVLTSEFFDRCQQWEIKLKLEKCIMGAQEVEYLGYCVGKDGVRPDPKKVEAIRNMPIPTTNKLLVSFLCKLGYHLQFIDNFQMHTKVLRQLLKSKEFLWKEEHTKAFEYLKERLCHSPVLAFFDPKLTTIIAADASDYAIGCVLKQIHLDTEGNETSRPVAYYSRVLNSAERNYHTTERECLAIIEAIKKFYPYIHGRHFLIETDHCALKYLKSIRLRNPRLTRWATLLTELQFDIRHVKGVHHVEADCLSRLPNLREGLKLDKREDAREPIPRFLREYEINALTLRTEDIAEMSPQFDELNASKEVENLKAAQLEDEYCQGIRSLIKQRRLDNVSACEILKFAEIDGVLSKIYLSRRQSSHAYVLPVSMREAVLKAYHDEFGHSGVNAMLQNIGLHFWFPNMREEIRTYVRGCHSCAARKPMRLAKIRSLDYEDFIPDASEPPFTYCSLDLITMPPTGVRGYKYILCIICMHTRYAVAVALKDQKTMTVIDAFTEHVVLKFGSPQVVLSDNGSNLHNDMYQAIVKSLSIRPKYIMPYRSNANGTVERFNQSLKSLLWFFCEHSPTHWNLFVNYACSAYNNTVHSVMGFAPITLVLGIQPRSFIHDLPVSEYRPLNREGQALTRIEFIATARQYARERLVKASKAQAKRLNRFRVIRSFNVGDEVYILQMSRPTGLYAFFWRPYDGPYVILGEHKPNVYEIRRHDWPDHKSTCVHVERMKPFCRLQSEPCFGTLPDSNEREPMHDGIMTEPLLPPSDATQETRNNVNEALIKQTSTYQLRKRKKRNNE